MIGEQIKKYRMRRQLTQEELGKQVGVTTQAVSKWERGGVPDAELLPHIAQALGVTIEMLFGQSNPQSLEDTLTDEILSMNSAEGFQRAFSLVTAICMGLSGLSSIKESFSVEALDKLRDTDGNHYYARASLDEGTINAKMDADFRYFFIMPEPKDGYAGYFADLDQLSGIFSLFADKDILRILFYMYSRQNTPVSLSLIAAKTDLPVARAEELMEKLCGANLAYCSVVETEYGSLKTYTFYNETVVLPLLCSARELTDRNVINWAMMFARNKPLF